MTADERKQILDQIEVIIKAVKSILDSLPVDNSLDGDLDESIMK